MYSKWTQVTEKSNVEMYLSINPLFYHPLHSANAYLSSLCIGYYIRHGCKEEVEQACSILKVERKEVLE